MQLTIQNVTKTFGETVVLTDVTCGIHDGDRIGIVGPNGSGKSTLLNILTGQMEPSEGTINRPANCRIGYLRQNSGLDLSKTIWEEMRSVFRDLLNIEKELRDLEKQLQQKNDPRMTARYADLQTYFEAREGYTIDVRIETVLRGMGFDTSRWDTVIHSLSGGEKTRLAIAKLLLEEPDLLILDEPTNHLDFITLEWLEDYLSTYKGALLIVSHDRYFLDRCVTEIWEVEQHKLVTYKGNYSAYLPQKQARLERLEKEYEAQQEQIASLEEYVQKNITRASTSGMAKSRMKTLEKMERLEKPFQYTKRAKLSFSYAREPVKDVLDVADLTLQVGEGAQRRTLVGDLSFHVFRGEKLAVMGGNGTGKTTLLRTLQRQLIMERGRIRWGDNVRVGYFRQEGEHLNPINTVIEELWGRYPSMTQGEVRSALAQVLIQGEDVFKRVSDLSGGERAKLSFAILMLQHPNVLILDEPTNHLDLVSKELLEQAMMDFTGTLILVSHDRFLLQKIPTALLVLENGSATRLEGGYDAYLKWKQRGREETPAIREERKNQPRGREDRRQRAQLRQKIRQAETDIEALEEEVASLEAAVNDPELYTDFEKMNQMCKELEERKRELSQKMDEWAALSEQAERQESSEK